jgi:hypothetical protein
MTLFVVIFQNLQEELDVQQQKVDSLHDMVVIVDDNNTETGQSIEHIIDASSLYSQTCLSPLLSSHCIKMSPVLKCHLFLVLSYFHHHVCVCSLLFFS